MTYLKNPLRGIGMPAQTGLAAGDLAVDETLVKQLLGLCPAYRETPLVVLDEMAGTLGVQSLRVKDERSRMGLGSFKALGAAFAVAKAAHAKLGDRISDPEQAAIALKGETFVTASAGNHGLSVAAGARIFGAQAVIYLAETVPAGFADRLRGFGAKVVVEGTNYEASMTAAQNAATNNGWSLLSDSTWLGNTDGRDVMEGYLAMAAETVAQCGDTAPTHVYLQAGVGGLAGAMAVYFRKHWGDAPQIIVVEPNAAPALTESIRAAKPIVAPGPVSNMGRLDCKEPSHLALKALARDADGFLTLSDEFVATEIKRLEPLDLATSPSGGAGFAGAVAQAASLGSSARVLVILSEGPSDD